MCAQPLTIASIHNPKVKAAARLRDAKARRQTGRFLIDGAREIARAANAGVELAEAFVCPVLCDSPEREEAARLAREVAEAHYQVTPEVFAKLAFGDRMEGVVTVAVAPRRTINELALGNHPFVAVVDGLEKPGNLGAILRSADAAGVSAVIITGTGLDLYNPNAIRASLGALFTLPVCRAENHETLAWLRSQRVAIYAARVGGGRLYTDADLTQPSAIVLGSEAHGLGEFWTGADIIPIELPMRGAVDSLNVSAVAAVLFYEALRQRALFPAKPIRQR